MLSESKEDDRQLSRLISVKQRVSVLFERLGPYHFTRLRAAGELLQITAIELYHQDETYAWDLIAGADGFERITLFPGTKLQSQSNAEMAHRVHAALDLINPCLVLVPGWSGAAVFAAIRWAVTHGVPIIVMSESSAWDEIRTWWKEWIKRRVMSLYSAALVGGRSHAAYVVQLGMPAASVADGYDAIDTYYFGQRAKEIREHRADTRHQYHLPENYFLSSARFVEKKNLSRLIQAYGAYRNSCQIYNNDGLTTSPRVPWSLVLLGDGPLRELLRDEILKLGLQDQVLLPGFKQYSELPVYYALAGAFVHASTTEQWGLVVNEAMASGLPVLVSKRCGCAADLVQEGRNGFIFDPYCLEELALLLNKVSAAKFPLSDFGLASREVIAKWGPQRFASGMKSAVDCALEVGAKRASLFDRLLLQLLIW